MKNVELGPLGFRIHDNWRCRQSRTRVGCGWFLMGLIATACVFSPQLMKAPTWLAWVGGVILVLLLLGPLLYMIMWFLSAEAKTGLPRLVGDLRAKAFVISGPKGQTMHLTTDIIRADERPPDRTEIQQAFARRYGDRVVNQEFVRCGGGEAHGGVYLVSGNPWKKYTLYLETGPEQTVEIIGTARLGESREFERAYDEIFGSVRVS